MVQNVLLRHGFHGQKKFLPVRLFKKGLHCFPVKKYGAEDRLHPGKDKGRDPVVFGGEGLLKGGKIDGRDKAEGGGI